MLIHLQKSVNVGIDLPKKKRVKHGKGKIALKHINPALTSHYSLKSIDKGLSFDGLPITAKTPHVKEILEYRKDSFAHSKFGLYSVKKQSFIFTDELGIYHLKNVYTKGKNEKFVREYFIPEKGEIRPKLIEYSQKRQVSPTIALKKSTSINYLGKTEVNGREVLFRSVNYILTKATILAMGKNIVKVGKHEEGKKVQNRYKIDVDMYISAGEGNFPIHPSIETPEKRVLIKLPIIFVGIERILYNDNGTVKRIYFDERTIETYKFLENLEELLEFYDGIKKIV